MIRPYQNGDLDRLKEITLTCFKEVAIDKNIEDKFGLVGGHDWQWRKARHIDDDVAGRNAEGVFVFEENGVVEGYITCRLDPATRIGRIPNMAVMPSMRGRGVGRQLMDKAFDYFRENAMECAKIETLEQNPIGQQFYPSAGFEEVGRQIHYLKRL